MANINIPENDADAQLGKMMEMDRRRALRRASFGLGAAALAASGVLTAATPAKAANQGVGASDVDIFNFALNLEYVEAEFYLYATTGQGLPANLRTGVGVQGTTGRGELVPFKSSSIQQYAQKIAVDEMTHVKFIRSVLGSAAVAIPFIDVGVGPTNAFSVLAQTAGLVNPGQIFNPYGDDVSFLLGASIFEDVGVTAYAGAARYIGNPDYVEAAAGILAVEAYHAGAIRTLLAMNGAGAAFGRISAVRGALSAAGVQGAQEDVPIIVPGSNNNFAPTDANALAFRRNTRQVLNIVYGSAGSFKGLFFPQGLNGAINS